MEEILSRLKDDQVRYSEILPFIIEKLTEQADNFYAGRLSEYLPVWMNLTRDRDVLEMVQGMHLEFDCAEQFLPSLSRKQPSIQPEFFDIIDKEVEKLLKKGVISECSHIEGEVISPVFTREKRDGNQRMILNLKRVNEEITYHHFKMETLEIALTLITPGCFMGSLDLKDAYYCVPICEEHRKFLRFEWKGILYEYNVFPNGLAMAPRKFSKLLKPVFANLREKGHISTAYLDDSLLVGKSESECKLNIAETMELLHKLGFFVHPSKSVLLPSKQIQYLGVIINSENMTVQLTEERKKNLIDSCKMVLRKSRPSIRDVARVIGLIVASFVAVKFGPLHYRSLEEDKKAALVVSKGCFDEKMQLTQDSHSELTWWIVNVDSAYNDICRKQPDVTITSDASSKNGWGCCFGDKRTGGPWSCEEKDTFHINCLELKAAWLSLQCFESELLDKHVRIRLDNTSALAAINNMGTNHSVELNRLANEMWKWCVQRNIWISAAFIPGVLNVDADFESRHVNLDAEWMLNSDMLNNALNDLEFSPVVDLFASRLNAQLPRYFSFRPDPNAEIVDAFSVSWETLDFYAFAPFSVINRMFQKIIRERATGVVVVPEWKSQPWFPLLQKLLVKQPVRLPQRKNLLKLQSKEDEIHPLIEKKRLQLLVCKISGKIF